MEFLQSINHNYMVDFLAKQHQIIEPDITFEYNGEDYFAIDAVNNVVSVEIQWYMHNYYGCITLHYY